MPPTVFQAYTAPTAREDTWVCRRMTRAATVKANPISRVGASRNRRVMPKRAAIMPGHENEWSTRKRSRSRGMSLNQRRENIV